MGLPIKPLIGLFDWFSKTVEAAEKTTKKTFQLQRNDYRSDLIQRRRPPRPFRNGSVMYEYDFQSSYIHLYLQFVFDTFFDCYDIESIVFFKPNDSVLELLKTSPANQMLSLKSTNQTSTMVNSNTNRRIEINRSIIKNDHQYVQYIQRSRIEYSRSFFILQDILFFMDNIVPLAPQIIWTGPSAYIDQDQYMEDKNQL